MILLLVAAALAAFWFFGGDKAIGNIIKPLPSPTPVPAAVPDPEPQPAPTAKPTITPTPVPTPTPTPQIPEIFDDGTNGYMSSGLCIYDNKAFELFYGDDDAAGNYADLVSSFAGKLPGTRIYNMVVPNHSEFGLPERVRAYYGCTSQRQNTSAVYGKLADSVMPVDIYDVLNLHNNEYIYFNTDTHWSSLGAYYAYTEFCKSAGVEAASLDSFEKISYPGFTGYLEYATGESCLSENPDTIDVYNPKFAYTCEMSENGTDFYEADSINLDSEGAGYSMFIHGDNGCVRVQNSGLSTGKKLLMVKDSYGNAMAAFLTASFDEVHIVDFRHFETNLPAYCAENGITDVLFLNNVMSANTYEQHDAMRGLFE